MCVGQDHAIVGDDGAGTRPAFNQVAIQIHDRDDLNNGLEGDHLANTCIPTLIVVIGCIVSSDHHSYAGGA